jgi:hypothetical protein
MLVDAPADRHDDDHVLQGPSSVVVQRAVQTVIGVGDDDDAHDIHQPPEADMPDADAMAVDASSAPPADDDDKLPAVATATTEICSDPYVMAASTLLAHAVKSENEEDSMARLRDLFEVCALSGAQPSEQLRARLAGGLAMQADWLSKAFVKLALENVSLSTSDDSSEHESGEISLNHHLRSLFAAVKRASGIFRRFYYGEFASSKAESLFKAFATALSGAHVSSAGVRSEHSARSSDPARQR